MTAFLPKWRALDAHHSVRLLSGTAGSGRVVALVMPPAFAAGSQAPELGLQVAQKWAEGGEMVILADGCLENPRLHRGLGTDGETGLSDLLTGSVKLEDVAVAGPTPRLKIVPAGGRAILRDPEQVRERLAYMCGEFKTHGVTLAVFASLGSDLGRWVIQECTDIVILGREKDNPAAFLAPDEDRVRALLGPAADSVEDDAQLEVPFAAVESGDAPAPAPPEVTSDGEPSMEAPVGEVAMVEAPLVDGAPADAEDTPGEEPPAYEPPSLDAVDEGEGEEFKGAEEAAEEAPLTDPSALASPEPETEAPNPAFVDTLGTAGDRPVRRSTVRWTDEPGENDPPRPGSPGTGAPWTGGGRKPADPWALAAAQLRAQGTAEEKPPVPKIPRRSLEDPTWGEAPDDGVRFSVGPFFKRRSTLWGGGAIIAATLLVTFWPNDANVAAPSRETAPPAEGAVTEAPIETGTPAEGSVAGGEEAATPEGTDPATATPEGTQPPAATTQPPAGVEASPHPRYSAGLAALGSLTTALEWTTRIQRAAPEHLLYVAPVQVNGTVYFRVVAGLEDGASGVAGVITDLAEATGQDGSPWIVRETSRAYALGDFADEADARSRSTELTAEGIPAYVLAIDFDDGAVRYRVYAGGYPNASEASYLGGLLQQAGLDAPLVERRGRLPS